MKSLLTKLRAMDRQQFETLFTSSAFLVTNGLLFVNMFLLATALGDDGRGAVAAAYGNTVVIGWAFQIGVPAAAGYFAKDVDNRRVAMSAWAMMVLGAIPVALVMIPFYLWQLGGKSFTEGGESLQRWYLAFIILQLFNGPFLSAIFWLRGIGNTVRFNALLALPQVLITFGYLVLFISGKMTVNSALTSTFIMLSIGWIVGLTATKSWPGRGFSKGTFREIRQYGLRAWVGNLSFFVSLRIDQLLLVNFVDLSELGVYAVAAAISTLSGPIARGAAQAVLPFVRNANSDEERISRITSSLRQVSVLSFAILGAMALTAWWIIPFVLGDNFGASVRPLMILLPGAWATDVNQVLTTALSSFNRPEEASKAQVASAIATAIGLITLLSPYGIVGAAITTTVSYWVGLIVSYYYWRRLVGQVHRGEATGHTQQIEEPV
jgi:O-antigen/teichoic acid export membrane protein